MMQPFPEVISLPVFAGVDVCEVLLLAAVYGGSFFIKGAIGIGSISLMIILGAMILDPIMRSFWQLSRILLFNFNSSRPKDM
jgi:hypothetical protein